MTGGDVGQRYADQDGCWQVLDEAYNPRYGFISPHPQRYPLQTLWDECWHAIGLSRFGDPRALTILTTLFDLQLPNGFMPHVGNQEWPATSHLQWRSLGHSDITQPPMYGHALKVLAERGYDVTPLIPRAITAMEYLFNERLDPTTKLIRVVHPWETGCDDTPRFDPWLRLPFSRWRWNLRKMHMVRSLTVIDGAAVANRLFDVCPASFNALVAYNAVELADLLSGIDEFREQGAQLRQQADALVDAIDATWTLRPDGKYGTWADIEPRTGRVTSTVHTLEALLPLLVTKNQAAVDNVFAQLEDPNEFACRLGLAGVAQSEASYDPNGYWRGGLMAPIEELIRLAALRRSHFDEAEDLCAKEVAGIVKSGMSEHRNTRTGAGLGPCPQSWAASILHEADPDGFHSYPLAHHPQRIQLRWRVAFAVHNFLVNHKLQSPSHSLET